MRQSFGAIAALLIGLLIATGVHSKAGDQSHQQHIQGQQSKLFWTDAPLLALDKKRTRSFKRVFLEGLQVDEVTVYPSDAEENWPVEVKGLAAKVEPRSGMNGGYHWVGAVTEQDKLVQSVATVVYFSKPGAAPRPMLSLQKSTLDISPVKLPREHQNYRAGESWDFVVRFNGEPLENSQIVFETENKTREVLKTNQEGLVSIPFPDDFSKEPEVAHQAGHSARRKKAGFVLTVEHESTDRQYISHFNYHYATDALYKKNLGLGIGFALFGMIAAAPLLRKPKKGKKA